MKDNSMTIIVIFSISSFLILRFLMGISITVNFSRKKLKYYKKSKSFFDRWFFISARKMAWDKYSKYEGRVIHYTLSAQIIFALNIILHVCFLAEMIMLPIINAGLVSDKAANIIILGYMAIWLVLMWILGEVIYQEQRRYFRMKRKQK